MTAVQKILDFLKRSGLMDKIKQQLELEQKSRGNVIYFSEIATEEMQFIKDLSIAS